MKTFAPKQEDRKPNWYVVDATGQVLGRLASRLALLLQGKGKPTYARHLDMGDYVICINAEKVQVTGKKRQNKIYYHYSGYSGGLKSTSFERMIATHPERVITFAVKGMLPRNRLGRQMLKKLKVYRGPSHPHAAQNPQMIDLSG
jgi:large subunit ribosomal protein L13